jgi:hypothetical protein
MAAASSEPTVLDSPSEPGDETQEPQTKKAEPSETDGTDDGVETAESTASLDGEDAAGDLLGLDSPAAGTPHLLGRLGLLAILGAAGMFVLSVLAVSLVAKGTVLDVIVLITWLGVAGLSLAGVLLLVAAGFIRVVESSRRGREPTEDPEKVPG